MKTAKINIRSPRNLASILTMGVVIVSATAFADSTAGFYNGGGTLGNFANATGYFFTPDQNITVTALGIYDAGSPGFASSHDVGIFFANGTLVTATNLSAGISGYADSGSLFLKVQPVTLTSGTQYYIEGDNWGTDQYAYGTGAVTYAPQITWNGFGDSATPSIFGAVTDYGGLPGNLGPNFQFTVVPEPAPPVLAGLGGLAALVVARRRRQELRSDRRSQKHHHKLTINQK